MPDPHETKGMWVDWMLDPCCDFQLWPHPWPWPLIFKVKFLKSRNSGIGCPIDMERKGCELTECWTRVVTLNFDLTHDLDLEFSRSNFENAVFQEWEGQLTWNQRDVSRQDVRLTLWPLTLTSPMTLNFFKVNYLNSCISVTEGLINMERKGYESIGCYT